MYRFVLVTGIAVVLSVSGALGLARDTGPRSLGATGAVTSGASGVPLIPATASAGDLDAQVVGLQERLARVPGDGVAWAGLALAYVEQARVTANPAFYAQAEQAVERSRAATPTDNAAAEAAAAALAGARHDFSASLARADAALAIDPYQPHALAVRVDALTELGRYEAQLRAVRTADRRQPGVPVASRYSYALELRGDLDGASRVLERSLGSAAAADRAFLLTLLADLERRRGLLDRSSGHLDQALAAAPGHVPALASRARLAVARGDLALAVRTWQDVVTRLPLPEYLSELGELYEHLDRPDDARAQYDVVAATTQAFDSGDVNTDLELALFEADHGSPQRALTSARAEWRRRQSVHTADVLGWALHRTGEHRAALRYARQATRLGTQEPRLWLHRGTIEAALGLDGAARTHLRRGLAADPGLSPWLAHQARTDLVALAGRS